MRGLPSGASGTGTLQPLVSTRAAMARPLRQARQRGRPPSARTRGDRLDRLRPAKRRAVQSDRWLQNDGAGSCRCGGRRCGNGHSCIGRRRIVGRRSIVGRRRIAGSDRRRGRNGRPDAAAVTQDQPPAAVDRHQPAVGHGGGTGHRQRPAADCRAAGVAVAAGKRQASAPGKRQPAAAADRAGNRQAGSARRRHVHVVVEDDGGVDRIAAAGDGNRRGVAAGGQLQRVGPAAAKDVGAARAGAEGQAA